MMTRLHPVAAALAALLLAACGADHGEPSARAPVQLAPGAGAEMAARVDGTLLTTTLVDAVAKQHGLDPADPEQYQRATQDLIDYVLLAQQAERMQVGEQPDLAATAEAARLQGLAAAVLLAYRRAHPVTDAMVAEDYARQISEVGDRTYSFTQLLFYSEADAQAAAAELAAGKSFAQVHEEWKDRVANANPYTGVFPRQLPGGLGDVLTRLAPGQTSGIEHTDLGWHILHLDRVQPFDPPPLEEVVDTVRHRMQQKQADAWVQSLKTGAAIEISAKARTIPLRESDTKASGPGTVGRADIIVHDDAPVAAGDGRP